MLSPKEEAVLELIAEDSAYEDYFFSKVSNLKWFPYLKEKGYFSPEKAPGPLEGEKEGFYRIPLWNVLPYLEKVSQQVTIPENEKYIGDLLKIIKDTTEYHIEHNKILDNPRTWWYFVKILLNIPNDKISTEIIELIPIWLDTKFDTTLQGADIAEKLLAKFLDSSDPDDWKKAEKIIESITLVKWIKLPEEMKKGLFGKEEEPKTTIGLHWLIEAFIKQGLAIKAGEKCGDDVIFILANKLKEIFKRRHLEDWIDMEYKGDVIRISVKYLNDYQYRISFGLIKKELLAQEETNILRGVRLKPEEEFSFELTECKDRETFVATIRQNLLFKFKELNDGLERQLNLFYDSIFSDFSYVWFRTIFSVPVHVHNPVEMLSLILRDMVLAKARKDRTVTHRMFEKFLGAEYQYPLFRRIILFVIGTEWNDYKNTFWEMLKEDVTGQFFDDSHFEADLFKVLEKNAKQFLPEQKKEIKRIIERGPQRYVPEDNQDKYKAYWQQKWYSALKSDPEFAQSYEEKKKISQIEEEIPGKEPEVRIGPGPSPLNKEDILEMSNEELARYLISFKTEDRWRGPTVEALSEILMQTVREKPEKFTENLGPFLEIPYLHVCNILRGMKEAWNGKRFINWGELFGFIKKYINRQTFWENQFKISDDRWDANCLWVTGMVGELIQEGTRDDAWAFSEDYFDIAKETLFLILEKQKPEEREEIKDSVSYALNSSLGKLITALIYLALRIARVQGKKRNTHEVKWANDMKDKYDKLLEDQTIEAYTLFGEYMPNLYYLDKKWVEDKIKLLLNTFREKPSLWRFFIEGYLFGRQVYDNLYDLMREHYQLAIEYSFEDKDTEKLLVQHVCIGYLRGHENFNENSLFGKMLKKWKPTHIKEIVDFFWMQRDFKDDGNVREKIIDLWRWIYENKYKSIDNLNDDDKYILSNLSKLTVFLSQIDIENNNWLMLTAPFVGLDFNSSFFIEYLNELKDKKESIKYIGKIFLRILSEGYTPDFRQEDILSIVEYLYKSRYKEDADRICDIYGRRRFEFLRQIYEENNK